MKVLIKFSSRTETVENVSVDDKCLPIVAGFHPYPSSARDTSPFVHESALWFKTLALETVYIDCDRRLIYWAPVTSVAAGTDDILMRRSQKVATSTSEFIPSTATPLFKDSSVYDFDASLKEMMGKCIEAARKFFKKSQSTDDFHRVIAKILHMYILPSITFTADNIYCLTRARCLIELRLSKSEENIANKANSIVNLRNCLNALKTNILSREDLDSERYLRTCKKDFLEAFLKTIESDVDFLNLELTAQQSKVNWAKTHPGDAHKLSEFQGKRDSLFKDVEKCIKVREAIKNVISRRNLTKRKVKKFEIINSCFHNVFVEIVRRLEIEDHILGQLGNDKVNICAAREAVVCTILEMVSSNRNSDLATKFEPEDFADFSVSESQQVKKSDVWLTFQERVAKVLKNSDSVAFKLHKEGCRDLTSKINLALSEFHLTQRDAYRQSHNHKPPKEGDKKYPSDLPLNVSLRDSKVSTENSKRRQAVLIDTEYESCVLYDLCPITAQTLGTVKADCDIGATLNSSDKRAGAGLNSVDRRALSTNDININLPENHTEVTNDGFGRLDRNEQKFRRRASETSLDDILAGDYLSTVNEEDVVSPTNFRKHEYPLKRQRHLLVRQLALSSLMNSVDNLKVQIRSHFREVIDCLEQELHREDVDETSTHEQQELLWKSYERFFCEEVYTALHELYVTGLTPAIKKAYSTLRKTLLSDILKDDKLLDLFFGQKEVGDRAMSIPIPSHDQSEDKMSMSRTLSALSLDVRCCNIKDLYSLANADCDDLRKRFDLDSFEADGDDVRTSSSCSDNEETFDMNSDSPATSAQSAHSSGSLDKDCFDETERLKIFLDLDKVAEILDPILSPFRKLIGKCLLATCFLDKVRYITKATEGLNRDISQMIGPDFQSACDDIISMLILALYNLPDDMFVGLYINLRLLMDVLPGFLSGTLWDYNLVTLCASYDYLFTLKVCDLVVRQYPDSFKAKR